MTQDLLSFLDGQCSWNHSYIIGTTNYPQKLPENIVDRPSRFDTILRIDPPNADSRRKYLSKFLGGDKVTTEMIKRTDKYSVAYLKEIAIQMLLKDRTFDDLMKDLDERKKDIKNYFMKGNPDKIFT